MAANVNLLVPLWLSLQLSRIEAAVPIRYHVLLNARAGAALARGTTRQELERLFEKAGLRASIDADMDLPMADRLSRLRESNAEVIVAAGGDGTVTAVASALIGTPKALAILPLGTVNALARDIGVPIDLTDWIAALAQMQPRQVDVGELNGQIFLHKVVVGVIPALAAGREQVRGGSPAAKLAFLRFAFRRLLRSRRMAMEIVHPDGAGRIHRVFAFAVANNEYDEAPGRLFARSRFDEGRLYIYLLKHLSVLDLGRLTVEMLLGRWRDDDAVQIDAATQLIVRTRKKTLKVMLDGEVQSFLTPLRFRIRPLSLTLLAPVPVAASELAIADTNSPA
jgi:diacylglycerol kinase family enzyme